MNTYTTILKCLEKTQEKINIIEGLNTKVIHEAMSNIDFMRSSVEGNLENSSNIFNIIKNTANMFSILAGLGKLLKSEIKQQIGFQNTNDYAVNSRLTDNYIDFIVIDNIVTGGVTGKYSGIARGEIVQLTGDSIPAKLGYSIIYNICDILNNYTFSDLGTCTSEQSTNVCLIINTFYFCLIKNLARIAVRIEFNSFDDIEYYNTKIIDAIDNILDFYSEQSVNGAVGVNISTNTEQIDTKIYFDNVKKIKSQIVDGLQAKNIESKKLYDFTSDSFISCLELAYRKYNDITRDVDIMTLNNIKNPAFIPGNTVIKLYDQ